MWKFWRFPDFFRGLNVKNDEDFCWKKLLTKEVTNEESINVKRIHQILAIKLWSLRAYNIYILKILKHLSVFVCSTTKNIIKYIFYYKLKFIANNFFIIKVFYCKKLRLNLFRFKNRNLLAKIFKSSKNRWNIFFSFVVCRKLRVMLSWRNETTRSAQTI